MNRVLPAVLWACSLACAQQSAWEVFGPVYHSYTQLAPFGDYDRDGYRDVVIGVFPNLPGSNVLEVRVLSGRTGHTIASMQPLGVNRLCNAGDMDGDGLDEVAIRMGYPILPGAYCVEIWSLRLGAKLWEACGSWNAEFGFALLGDLDTDGDGRPDLVTLTRGASESDVYVYDNRGQLRYTLPCHAFGLTAISLANMGDMDQDGCDDFVVGCSDLAGFGVVFLVSGRSGTLLRASYGLQAGDKTFANVTNLGDIDGDGVNDYAAFPWWSASRLMAVLWSGATGTVIRTLPVYTESVIATEDLDLDGVNDLVLGWEYPVSPPNTYGRTQAISGRDGTELWAVENYFGSGQGPTGWGRFAAGLGVQPGSPYPAVVWLDLLYQYLASPGVYANAQGRIRAFVGNRAGQGPVTGTGCSSTGIVPQIGVRETPTGSRITIAHGSPGAWAWLHLAVGAAASYGGVPLPVSLAPFGFGGCTLYVGPDITFGRQLGTAGIDRGYAAVDLPIHLAATQGLAVSGQWLVFDPTALDFAVTAKHALRLQ